MEGNCGVCNGMFSGFFLCMSFQLTAINIACKHGFTICSFMTLTEEQTYSVLRYVKQAPE